MANVRIIEQPEITTLSGGEFLVTDSQAAGTKKITPANLVASAGGSGVSDDLKTALLQLASKVAYIDDDGQEYYDDLYDALYNTTWSVTNTLIGCSSSNSAESVTKNGSYSATITASVGYTLTGATVSITMGGNDITSTAYSNGTISIASVTGALVISVSATAKTVSSISAVYTQSGTVYDTDSLDSLKSDLVVTATYSDSSTAVVPSADYTLSGTLTAGTSTITVTYEEKTTSFNVTVTAAPLYALANAVNDQTNYRVTTTKGGYVKIEFKNALSSSESGKAVNLYTRELGDLGGASSVLNNKPKVFTIPSGKPCVYSISNVEDSTGITANHSLGLRKAMTNTSVSDLSISTIGTGGSKTATLSASADVACPFLYIYLNGQTISANSVYEFAMSLTIDGVRWV